MMTEREGKIGDGEAEESDWIRDTNFLSRLEFGVCRERSRGTNWVPR